MIMLNCTLKPAPVRARCSSIARFLQRAAGVRLRLAAARSICNHLHCGYMCVAVDHRRHACMTPTNLAGHSSRTLTHGHVQTPFFTSDSRSPLSGASSLRHVVHPSCQQLSRCREILCGEKIRLHGVPLHQHHTVLPSNCTSDKHFTTAMCLSAFLGGTGADRFYLGQ